MSKTYIFRVLGRDQYKVVRVDNKLKPGQKGRFMEYHVDLRNEHMCDCKGFYFTKKPCKHIKTILAQLKDGGGILEFEKVGDYDKLIEHVRRTENYQMK